MESFESQFWRCIKNSKTKGDSAARHVLDKIERVFSGRKQRLVVSLLGAISDPSTEKRWKHTSGKISAELTRHLLRPGPSRKELKNLSRRLRTIERDLNQMFGTEEVWSSKKSLFLKLAEDCGSRAKDLKYTIAARALDPTPLKVPRVFTYKAFWKHVPIAKLCRELEVPWAISFGETETLLRCAYSVRKRPWSRPARSIEREYKGFRKLKSNNPIHSAAWPKVLDRFLLTLPTK